MTIPEGASITVPSGTTLTNNGTIAGQGSLAGKGTLVNNGDISVADNDFMAAVEVSASPSPATYGGSVTLTATVKEDGTPVNGGSVTFYQGGDALNGTGTSVGNGIAAHTIDELGWTPGDYAVTAVYTPADGSDLIESSGSTTLTVSKAQQSAPGAPTASTTTPPTAYSVTLDAVTTVGQGAVQYGYATGGETAVPEERWQSGTTFDGLTPGTTYMFHARYAGTSLYEPSPASAGTPVTTERADSTLTVVPAEGILTYGETLKITVTPEQTAAYGINALTTAQDVVELKTGDAVLASATTANADGSYTLTYDTRGKGLAIGNNALTVSYGGSGSLNPSTGGVTVTLEKAYVDAALDGTTSKTYDGTTAAPDGLVIALTGVLEGDEVAASSASIAYDSADAGNNRTITATGITLTGEHAAYYSLMSETASVQTASISKVTPALALTADPAALSGGGRVTLTLAGVPDGGSATVTCDGDVDVTEGSDGTWVAELPNQTADYTFTASYAGDGNHSAAQAACVVTTSYAPPYVPPAKTPSQQAIDKIRGAKDGDTVKISLSSGDTKLDKEVFQALAGRDVTLVLEMGEGVSWEIRGGDVPEGTPLSDVDMGVEVGTDGIPVEVVDLVTAEAGVVQATLAHDGEFGFELTLVAPLGEKSDGLFANLYRYDEARERCATSARASSTMAWRGSGWATPPGGRSRSTTPRAGPRSSSRGSRPTATPPPGTRGPWPGPSRRGSSTAAATGRPSAPTTRSPASRPRRSSAAPPAGPGRPPTSRPSRTPPRSPSGPSAPCPGPWPRASSTAATAFWSPAAPSPAPRRPPSWRTSPPAADAPRRACHVGRNRAPARRNRPPWHARVRPRWAPALVSARIECGRIWARGASSARSFSTSGAECSDPVRSGPHLMRRAEKCGPPPPRPAPSARPVKPSWNMPAARSSRLQLTGMRIGTALWPA